MWASGRNGDICGAAYGYEPTREAAMARPRPSSPIVPPGLEELRGVVRLARLFTGTATSLTVEDLCRFGGSSLSCS
jgi:hypothetical protein